MPSRRTITVHHARAVLRGAQRRGFDALPLLQRAGIPPLLLRDDTARVTPEQFTALVRAVYTATDDEFLGLGAAPSKPGTFAMMCCAALGCEDLGAATERAFLFYGLFPSGPRLALERHGPGRDPDAGHGEALCVVRNDLSRDEDRFVAQCLVVVWHRLSSWLIGDRIPLLRAEFAHPAPAPPHRAEYELLLGCPVRFGAERTAAAMDARRLSAPVVQDEATLGELLRRAPAALLSRHDYGTTVAEQVRRVLVPSLRAGGPARLPEAADVAARLAVSASTLRRRLRQEGTSFQELKDAVRQDAAIEGLVGGREPIAAVAARLGFSEDTAFHRAFRRWTGTTPGAFRSAAGGAEPFRTAADGTNAGANPTAVGEAAAGAKRTAVGEAGAGSAARNGAPHPLARRDPGDAPIAASRTAPRPAGRSPG
ncbi:AraC family transcriptional regulator [Streptomyces sp. NPDC048639]|uniref:AraC family transcriptional regulator n=1 Tax=Streptomyces sp. NPDC048639 TaxID=3365581 RepID=UPI00371ACF9B